MANIFENFKFVCEYVKNGVKFVTDKDDDTIKLTSQNDDTFKVFIDANTDIEVKKFYIELNYKYADGLFYANGFQSWTDTKEFRKDEKMANIGFNGSTIFGQKLGMQYVGDYTFVDKVKKAGEFHSHGYCYIRRGNNYDLIASVSDRDGYTIIKADMNMNKMYIYKDIEGEVFSGNRMVLNLVHIEGGYDEVFDKYFEIMNIKPRTNLKLKGYTSWYNYYENVRETDVLRDLEKLTEATKQINVFQIDDGYQTAVGDWLSINREKFPDGMKFVADKIHEKGLMAGIWLAPFGARKGSKLATEHPDWLIKKNGKPFMVGANWGGFYAIDIYNDEARAYIKNVFDIVLNEWGYDLVKLDFLYAASVLPIHNKCRGRIIYDALELLRECVGDKLLLGCGCQMMPAFGVVDYMRIGADMSLQWKHNLARKMNHREDVSTINALNNSMYRRHLDGRAFLNDTDVFLLRDYRIKFTFEQRKLLARIIKVLGKVLFTSDDVSSYNEAQMACMIDTYTDENIKVTDVVKNGSVCTIEYTIDDALNKIVFDLATGEIL